MRRRCSPILALAFLALVGARTSRAEAPAAPASVEAPDAPAPSTRGAKKKRGEKRKIEIDEIKIEGEAQKPSVMFVDGGREQLRRTMQSLLSETRTGGEVSAPREYVAPRLEVERVVARGIDETAVRSRVVTRSSSFALCGRTSTTAVRVSLALLVDEGGRPRSAKVQAAHPEVKGVVECAARAARALKLPQPAAGSARVELTLVIPAGASASPAEAGVTPAEARATPAPASTTTPMKEAAQRDAIPRRRSSAPSTSE